SFRFCPHHPDLHSFPTRRSSDLRGRDQPRRRTASTSSALATTASGCCCKAIVGFGGWGSRRGLSRLCFSFLWGGARTACFRAWKDRKSTRLNSSHVKISYAVFCL